MVTFGSVNAGKTTFIRSLSEIPPITTDAIATDHVASTKRTTTVAMDMGKLTVDEDLVLHIYGTPGQERFDFMWEMLAEHAFGYVFLVNASEPEDLLETKKIREFVLAQHPRPHVIGVTKTDLTQSCDLGEIAEGIGTDIFNLIPLDARDTGQCIDVVLALLAQVEAAAM